MGATGTRRRLPSGCVTHARPSGRRSPPGSAIPMAPRPRRYAAFTMAALISCSRRLRGRGRVGSIARMIGRVTRSTMLPYSTLS